MVFTNAPCCTVWEKTVQNRAPTYIRHTMSAVYWEDTNGIELGARTGSKTSRNPDHTALIIIPAANLGGYLPKADDRILRGNVSDTQPPQNALTVASVKDFRYGSANVQHIEVTAK